MRPVRTSRPPRGGVSRNMRYDTEKAGETLVAPYVGA